MRAVLEFCTEGKVTLWRAMDQPQLSVGSHPECDLCVPDPAVAAFQCLLRLDRDRLLLQNKSETGTRVGDVLEHDALPLAHGDRIVLGPTTAVVRFLAPPPDAEQGGATRDLAAPSAAAAVSAVAAEVTVVSPGVMPERRFTVDERGLTIGSDPSNAVVLSDPYVSAFHARLVLEAGRCTLYDLGSRNGVFVAGQKIRAGEIAPGASITLGTTTIAVHRADSEAPRAGRGPSCPPMAPQLVGSSPEMEALRDAIRRIAEHDAATLVTGQTGSGKEVVAHLLVEQSPRAAEPFLVLNCGALSRTLTESELFGHERGAFTGAVARKAGAFEAADGGTLFLDEVGELPLELQPQLLRVLETGEVRRVGATNTFRVDVRVIAATNVSLPELVARGRFRSDLYHRLCVLELRVPALQEHPQDIPELARHFLDRATPAGQSIRLADAAAARLLQHPWEGNVRELRNTIDRSVMLRARGDVLDASDLRFCEPSATIRARRSVVASAVTAESLHASERQWILGALRRHRGNKTEAALALGISRSTMHRRVAAYSIDLDELECPSV